MQTTVKLLGMLGHQMGKRQVTLRVKGGVRISEILQMLVERFGSKFTDAIFREAGELHSYTRIFLNDKPVDDLSTALATDTANGTGDVEEAEKGIIRLAAADGG